MMPLASSRSNGRAGRFHAARLGRAGQRQPQTPPLMGLAVVGRPVALADLEDRDVLAALALVRRHDLEQAARAGSGA